MSDEMLLTALAWSVVQVVRALPALVWSLRCQPSSDAYRCPPVFPARRRCSVEPGSGSSGRPVMRQVPARGG